MEILFGRLCGCGRWQSAGDGDEAGGGLGARAGAGRAGIANHGSSDEGGGGKGKGLMPQARELGRKDGQEASGRNRSHGRRHLFWRSADGAREGEGAEHVKGRRRRVAHLCRGRVPVPRRKLDKAFFEILSYTIIYAIMDYNML